MNEFDWFQIIMVFGAVTIFTPLLGKYMAKVVNNERTFLSPLISPLEKLIYKLIGLSSNVENNAEMPWKLYLKSLLAFNFIGFVFVLFICFFQGYLPLNPQKLPAFSWDLGINTAISFVTNTNWQAYSGENTASYLTQMLAFTVQNFLSAATGFAVLLALIRGISRKHQKGLGNFWVDVTRITLYILLPLSVLYAVLLIGQGVIQNFHAAYPVTTLEGIKQLIPQGPAASQIAIKQLGTNGGGFFNANSAHPFENPTPFSNFLQLVALVLIPAASVYTFGQLTNNKKHAKMIFLTMMIMVVIILLLGLWSEFSVNPIFHQTGIMEGKETRFGITNSVLWSTLTTAASNGSVNAMHSSLSPLTGGLAMFNIMLGEIIFGGVGSGLYGMIVFIILTVFLAGLMVGRTPEYLGKKIEAKEIQLVITAILIPNALILIGSAISVALPISLSYLSNHGPHGLSEILYAFSSASGNNGSAFAGLNANNVYYNLILSVCMLLGRFGVIIPTLAIAGSLVQKNISPPSLGTFKTDNYLFVVVLLSIIVLVGGLTFFPALSLGPIIEHLLMIKGQTF